MKIKHSLSLTVLFTIVFQFSLFAQNRFFNYNGENASRPTTGKREIFPQKFGGFTLDIASLKNFLWSLPSESSVTANRNLTPVMEIPMPDGTMAKFHPKSIK